MKVCAICWEDRETCHNTEHAKASADRVSRRGRTWGAFAVIKGDGSTRLRTISERMESRHPQHCELELLDGDRHHLDGRPIHCGELLLLQHQVVLSDDFGEFTGHPDRGDPVRYEVGHVMRDGRQVRIPVMYTRVGGHSFSVHIDINHYFRWPEE